MVQNSDGSGRRILKFPAVRPCEGISPATLLASLIGLSRNIVDYSSKSFPTQRRNAREAKRQIGILLMFFEEIQDQSITLPESTVLGFSELHVAFQKIQFLVEDCTREGAKLWILMKSEFVSGQFRILIRAVATALDVLPLHSIGVSGEIMEIVELVTKQARKAKFEVDEEDERASGRVRWILEQFENGFEPERRVMKWVLNYLQIRTWSDCNKEIKFLQDEMGLEEREAPFLSSLVGFMSYCRGVVFETLGQDFDRTDGRCSFESHISVNPEDFRCPISLELMTDPVTVSTGQTYNRSSIQKWFKSGNFTCPKTGEKLTNTELVPNTALRNLIHQFCSDNHVSISKSRAQSCDITTTIAPGSPAAASAMKFLSGFLARKLVFGTGAEKNKAAFEARLLAKSSIFNRSCLIKAGVVIPLLNLLSSAEQASQENAIAALLKLSKHTSGKRVIVESGGLKPILAVLKSGLSLEAKQIAAATVFYLSSVKGYRKMIGESPEAIPALTELLRDGTVCGKKNAVVAIFGLLLFPKNHQRVLAAGAVPFLVDILPSSEKPDLVSDSLAVIATLADSADGTFEILKTSALSQIKAYLNSSTSLAGKEHCVSILLSLCNNGGSEVISVLASDPSLMTSLYSLITEGTGHASQKARSLIRILHKFQEASYNSAVHRRHSVHVW